MPMHHRPACAAVRRLGIRDFQTRLRQHRKAGTLTFSTMERGLLREPPKIVMNYWLDLFTGTTWQEFLAAGANVSGFREVQRKITKRVQPGDMFLCYLTGVMRWVGALEVIKPSTDQRPIWKG